MDNFWLWFAGILFSGFTVLAMFTSLGSNLLEFWDRWRKKDIENEKEKFKKTYRDDNPDFEFRLGHISNTSPGICTLSLQFKNLSGEVQFVEPMAYCYEFRNDKNRYCPSGMIADHNQRVRRLEHSERFAISVNFESFIYNNIYNYWKKDVQVYATCRTGTDVLLRSNTIEFDKLAEHLVPLIDTHKVLAAQVAEKVNCDVRNIEATLWMHQIYQRTTSHIIRQLQENGIPIMEYLVNRFNISLDVIDSQYKLLVELDRRQFNSKVIIEYLEQLVQQ